MQRIGPSAISLLIGIALGIVVGLVYAWLINPVVITNLAPGNLSASAKQQYIIAISVAYGNDHDIVQAGNRLAKLDLGDQTFQVVADTACDLARSNFASTSTGLTAIKSMIDLAGSQGKSGCASTMISFSTPTPTPAAQTTEITDTPTLPPVDTKTPSPTPGPTYTPATQVSPTVPVQNEYQLLRVGTLPCNPKYSGVIEVNVYDLDGKTGLPGIPIHISGDANETFFTGLKPERGDGYADYQMAQGSSYTIILDGADRKPQIDATACTSKDGKALISYEVDYRRVNKP